MKNHENEYWLLEQWGLWNRRDNCYPTEYNGGTQDRYIGNMWEISDETALEIEATIRGMQYLDRRAIKRYYVNHDYDVKQDILQISINRFAVAFGLADESQVCAICEPKPRKVIARRRPGPWLHPDRNVRKVLCWLPKRPKITMEWLKVGI